MIKKGNSSGRPRNRVLNNNKVPTTYGATNRNISVATVDIMENEDLEESLQEVDSDESRKSIFSRLLSGMKDMKKRSLNWSSTSISADSSSGTTYFSDSDNMEYLHTNLGGDAQEGDRDFAGDDDGVIDGETSASFCTHFLSTPGPAAIIFMCMLYALAAGATIGVVPSVMTDQYAKVYHGFDHHDSCANYGKDEKPQACQDGASNAQTAAVSSSFVSNTLTFLTSSLIGSLSDEYGRRHIMNLAQFLNLFSPICLVMMQTFAFSSMDPNWYYFANCLGGLVSWISTALSALSDVMPKQWRAPMFGLLLAGFSLGFALSPFLALVFSHHGVSILSMWMILGNFLFGLFFLPETLSREAIEAARSERSEYHRRECESLVSVGVRMICRPIKELSILNRNSLLRLLSALAFFSGMSSSADQTLFVYYVEERLEFNDRDIAVLFGIIGLQGIIVQGLVLKPFTDWIGERYVVVVSFICGAVTNTLYAFARSKDIIYIAVCVSSFGTMSFPTISAMKSNNVKEHEIGRVQGALFALSSLASALGPALLRIVYKITAHTRYPGSFFLVATAFFIVATGCGWALPKEKANSVAYLDDADVDTVDNAHAHTLINQNMDMNNTTRNDSDGDESTSIRESLLQNSAVTR